MRTHWASEDAFTIDGVTYSSTVALDGEAHRAAMAAGHLVIFKDRPLVELYEDLIERSQPRTILELGICHGGGAALLAQLAKPDKLIALDYNPNPCGPLEDFIDTHGLRSKVSAYYGVDQADTVALDRIMAAELDGPLDLVVDDASHLVDETRASFNRLFPHVRPGGLYVIEDWSWAHLAGKAASGTFADAQPLSALVVELVLATCRIPRAIAEVTVGYHWAVVRRGDAVLRPDRFDVTTHFDPLAQQMVDRIGELQVPYQPLDRRTFAYRGAPFRLGHRAELPRAPSALWAVRPIPARRQAIHTSSMPYTRAAARRDAAQLVDIESRLAPFVSVPLTELDESSDDPVQSED